MRALDPTVRICLLAAGLLVGLPGLAAAETTVTNTWRGTIDSSTAAYTAGYRTFSITVTYNPTRTPFPSGSGTYNFTGCSFFHSASYTLSGPSKPDLMESTPLPSGTSPYSIQLTSNSTTKTMEINADTLNNTSIDLTVNSTAAFSIARLPTTFSTFTTGKITVTSAGSLPAFTGTIP